MPVRSTCGLSRAKKIGIVFRLTSGERDQKIIKLGKDLATQNIIADLLAYTPSLKSKKGNPPLDVAIFTDKDLNWLWFPKSKKLNDFINNDFDILISLCTTKCMPVESIVALSKAGFRVGAYSNHSLALYDFMVQNNFKGKEELLMQEIIHYLNIIK